MQRNTSHSRVSEIHSSTVTPTHASELVIDRAVGAMMAREARKGEGQAESGPVVQEQTVPTIITVFMYLSGKTHTEEISLQAAAKTC